MTSTVTIRTWQRWLLKRQADYSQQAHRIVKQYESIADAPKEILDALTWAIETDNGE